MGSAANKKRKRRAEPTAAEAPPAPPLEEFAAEPYVPPRAVTAGLALVTLAGCAFFAVQGVQAAQVGEGKLAASLLDVKARNEAPTPFNLAGLDGKKLDLGQFRDKVVFVNFWATWCPPCVEEMPSMRRLQAKLANDDRFVMLAISADEGWDPVRTFFENDPPPFKVLLDENGTLAKKYGTEKFPETYVLVDGRLVGYIVGPRDWDTWYAEAYLRSLLKT